MRATTADGLWIDDRYRGAHGIGRYAHEVISRLSVPWQSLGLSGRPANPLDVLRRLPREVQDGLVYSPGYGALLSSRKQILTIHDLIHLKVDWPGRAKYLAYYNGPVRRAIRRAGVVLTVSETSRHAIESWLSDERVRVVNAGIGSSSVFQPTGLAPTEDDPYVLFVGNLRAHKNLDTLVRAMGALDGVRLKAVVPGSEIDEARRLGRTYGAASRVDWLSSPSDEELAALYRGARATAMPSILEGFGLPALESIRCGTPVVYWSGCDAVAEIVATEGLAVQEARTPSEWARGLTLIVNSGRRADPRTVDRYDWSIAAEEVQKVLEEELDFSG